MQIRVDKREMEERREILDQKECIDVPEGCEACGGPYPLCCDGCPLFVD